MSGKIPPFTRQQSTETPVTDPQFHYITDAGIPESAGRHLARLGFKHYPTLGVYAIVPPSHTQDDLQRYLASAPDPTEAPPGESAFDHCETLDELLEFEANREHHAELRHYNDLYRAINITLCIHPRVVIELWQKAGFDRGNGWHSGLSRHPSDRRFKRLGSGQLGKYCQAVLDNVLVKPSERAVLSALAEKLQGEGARVLDADSLALWRVLAQKRGRDLDKELTR